MLALGDAPSHEWISLEQRFPTWVACTLGAHLPIWRGTFIAQPQQINF